MNHPELSFEVSTTDRTIIVRHENGRLAAACLDDVVAVYVDTSDIGPWDADVWFVLVGEDDKELCTFPLGAMN